MSQGHMSAMRGKGVEVRVIVSVFCSYTSMGTVAWGFVRVPL